MSDSKQDVSAEIKDLDQELPASADKNNENETASEHEENSTAEINEQQDPEKLLLLLEDARSKVDEHWDQCLRLKAESENLRRRHERELEKAHKFALENFAKELLPVADSLELGLNAAGEKDADVSKILKEGSELTFKLLKNAMEKFGLKILNPVGEPFNPDWHQAMSIQPSDKVSPNTVINVFQKGYQLNERLLRPAMVVVAKAGDDSTTEGTTDGKSGSGKGKKKNADKKSSKATSGTGDSESHGAQINENT